MNKKNEDLVIYRKTLVIFGVSSFVGSSLAEFFKKDYKVIGTYNKNPVSIPGVLTIPCDVLVKEEVQLVLFAFKPEISLYCAGISSIQDCSKYDDRAEALNTSGLFNVAEYCHRYKSQICYISSSFVFGGENRSYIEMDIPDPNTIYGKTQAAAEFYIQKTSLNYVIFRTSKLYGRGINSMKPTFFENLQRKLKLNQPSNVDSFLQTGFMDVAFLGMVMKICFDKGVQNRLLQVTTSDTMNHYEFAKTYCEVFGESADLISKAKWALPVMQGSGTGSTLRYKLDLANIEGFLNIEMPTIKESLEFTYKRLNGDESSKGKSSKGEGVQFI
ncbi:sugar nucleotide-binding protein [Bacteriovoracaceae bacterium]|nr:sugar nucleotide-binding protein [Bacteriovoracaceae bacterium]